MRAFGSAPDLDIDFARTDRPNLVTALLAHCDARHDPAFWWEQPVGARTAALLRLVAATEERESLAMSAQCSSAACGEYFDFDLPLRSLPGPAAGIGPLRIRLGDERVVTMRCPTGEDLRRWHAARPRSRPEAVRLMLDSLVVSGQVKPDDEAAVSASIASIDPLVDFSVSCSCPACGSRQEIVVDLEALAVRRLARRQHALIRDVHRLASQYGWTEAESLAVPASRRALYLELIEGQP